MKTIKVWFEDHYPFPAKELANASDEACTNHCLNKWKGAKKENLPEGTVYKEYTIHFKDPNDVEDLDDDEFIFFGEETCALCRKYISSRCYNHITKQHCPIIRMQGHACDSDTKDEPAIYQQSKNDPQPMIDLLEKVIEFIHNEK